MKAHEDNNKRTYPEGGCNPAVNATDRAVSVMSKSELKSLASQRVRSIDPGQVGLFNPERRKNWAWDEGKFRAEQRRQAPKKPRGENGRVAKAAKALEAATRELEELQRQMAELLKMAGGK